VDVDDGKTLWKFTFVLREKKTCHKLSYAMKQLITLSEHTHAFISIGIL